MRKPLTSGQKGAQGEKQVARHLRWLSKKQYIVLSDLMLLQGRRLTQIDHVVVSVYGIFVIETKNYHGTITGTERKEFWTQERHGKRYNFRSPFRQNYAHIRALMQLLGLDEDCFFSIAAFADDAVLAVEQEEDSVEQLVHFREVRRNIRRQRQMLLAWDDVRYYAGTILCANLDTPQARQTHLEQIDNEIAYRNFALRNGLCPRCGGKLVLRHGTYGDFYGCSNYPACRYTLKTRRNSAKMGMYTSNPLHSFELRTEENKVVRFFEMKYEKTLAFSSRMCYTTKVHKSYLIYAIKRVRHSGVCRRKVGAAFFY